MTGHNQLAQYLKNFMKLEFLIKMKYTLTQLRVLEKIFYQKMLILVS